MNQVRALDEFISYVEYVRRHAHADLKVWRCQMFLPPITPSPFMLLSCLLVTRHFCLARLHSIQKSFYFCFFRRIKHGNWGNKEFLQLCKICESEMQSVINIWRKQYPLTTQWTFHGKWNTHTHTNESLRMNVCLFFFLLFSRSGGRWRRWTLLNYMRRTKS